MPRITFLNDDLSIEMPPGSTLSLAATKAEASLPFGCRAGTCGTCALRVVEGEEGLEEPGFVEQDTLIECGVDGPGSRLGCQIILGDGDLVLDW